MARTPESGIQRQGMAGMAGKAKVAGRQVVGTTGRQRTQCLMYKGMLLEKEKPHGIRENWLYTHQRHNTDHLKLVCSHAPLPRHCHFLLLFPCHAATCLQRRGMGWEVPKEKGRRQGVGKAMQTRERWVGKSMGTQM